MEADLQAQVAFYLTGKRPGATLDAIEGLGLSPALFSGYRDLTKLRYDFPLVLVTDRTDGGMVEPMSGLVDAILEKVAQGKDADRIRQHVLRLEGEIRALLANGAGGTFSALWDQAARPLMASDQLTADSLARARANLKIDGELVDCDETMPFRLLGHAWGITQTRRARKFSKDVNRLVLKLSDILKSDFVNSDAGKTAENLKSAFGAGPMDNFDFEAMSRILKTSTPKEHLPKSRRQRLQKLLAVLQSQQFFPTAATAAETTYSFAFDTCSSALKAYRQRLPKVISLAKAIAIAELEITGEYDESIHAPLIESFGENGLDAKDLALFPDYLVRLNAADMPATEQDHLTEILSADLPIKILVQIDDVIEESPVGNGHLAFALHSRQLASVAMGMNDVFVMQSPSSNLYRFSKQIQKGLDYLGPALFSVFSGSTGKAGKFPPYLVSAAALESRVFPAFIYDPSAGQDWASRFSLADNPQSEQDWPTQDFSYEDAQCRMVSEHVPFTLIDFVACDPRYTRHFARVPQAKWNGTLVPVGEIVALESRGHIDHIPSVLMVDPENRLQKVIVDEKLIRVARRCRSVWHSLQELGGIHNSHADRLLARERMAWEEQLKHEPAAPAKDAVPAAVAPSAEVAVAPAAAPAAQEAERSPDEAYIETARCSTCNECTQINNKMFAYDGNKQAYIADINAGTYAQLVEAAESCQVSVIHPGKPRNPKEAGLEDLLKRAEPFL